MKRWKEACHKFVNNTVLPSWRCRAHKIQYKCNECTSMVLQTNRTYEANLFIKYKNNNNNDDDIEEFIPEISPDSYEQQFMRLKYLKMMHSGAQIVFVLVKIAFPPSMYTHTYTHGNYFKWQRVLHYYYYYFIINKQFF